VYFSGAFNASYVHQIWQYLNQTNHLTSLYTPVLSVQANWHHSSRSADLKWPPHAALNYQIWQFMTYFEPTVRILPNQIKGQNFSPVSKRLSSAFHGPSMKKFGSKVGQKPASSPSFLLPPWIFFFSLYRGHWPPPPSSPVCPPSSPLQEVVWPPHMVVAPPLSFLCKLFSFSSLSLSLALPFIHSKPSQFPPPASRCPPTLASHRRHTRWSAPFPFLLLFQAISTILNSGTWITIRVRCSSGL